MLLAEPGEEALKTKTVTAVGRRTVLPLVSVPVVRRRIDTFPSVCSHQLIIVVHPHAATNDFTNTGHQAIYTLGNPSIVLVLQHVESLDLGGEVSQENRLVDDICHATLSSLGDIVTEFVRLAIFIGDPVLDEPVDGVLVLHALERPLWYLELGVKVHDVLLDDRVGHGDFKDTAHDLLQVVQ